MKHVDFFGKKNLITFHGDTSKIHSNFLPYFYLRDDCGEFVDWNGKHYKKVFMKTPKEVGEKVKALEKKGIETGEGDVRFIQRFLIDMYKIPFPHENFHKLYLDIETNYSVDTLGTPEPIICISAYSTKTEHYYTWVWKEGLPELSYLIKSNHTLNSYDKETTLLFNFLKTIKLLNPDVFIGWNVEEFDLPYIINRVKYLGLERECSMLSRTGDIYVSKGFNRKAVVGGRVIFDMLKAWRILSPNKLESKALAVASQNLLGRTKIEIDSKKLWNDIPKLIEYNKEDVALCVDINKQEGFFDFFDEVRREFGCTWESIYYTSGLHEVYALRKAKELGIILPTRKIIEKKSIKGATVLEAIPGRYYWIICEDVTSLYPSIISQLNISPETVGKPGYFLPNGVTFSYDKKGFAPIIIEDYITKRKYYKRLMNECEPKTSLWNTFFRKQWNYKIRANSFYGFLGYVNVSKKSKIKIGVASRLYNYDCYRSITFIGRMALNHIKSVVESKGYEVIYGDTDSVYIKTSSTNKEEVIEIGKKIEKIVNESFIDFVRQFGCESNKYLSINFEGINKTMFFGTKGAEQQRGKLIYLKKRYAYHRVWEEGKEVDYMGFKGFEIIRSDSAKITQTVQERIFEMLIKERATKADVEKYITDIKEKMQQKDFSDWESIGVPKTITKPFDQYESNAIHVSASKFSNEYLKLDIRPGDKIKYIYGQIIGMPSFRYFAFRKNKDLKNYKIRINWEKMFSLLIDDKVKRLFMALGWDDRKEQTGLNTFLKK